MRSAALDDMLFLLRVFYDLVESCKGMEMDLDEGPAYEGLTRKVFDHTASAIHLIETPTQVPGRHMHFVDVASVRVLARAACEAALALHYLVLVPIPPQDRMLRVLVYRLGGFLERRSYPVVSEEGKRAIAQDQKDAALLRERIRAHPLFATLSEAEQRKAEQGLWKPKGEWKTMAEEAGIDGGFFSWIYGFLCAYAHSGALSAGQLSNMNDKATQMDHAVTSLRYFQVPLAKVILGLARRFPAAAAALQRQPALADRVRILGSIDKPPVSTT